MENNKQNLADIIQSNESVIKICRNNYNSKSKDFYKKISNMANEIILEAKKELKDNFKIDYDSSNAKNEIIKIGSKIIVNVNHMDGMKGSSAIVKDYSITAMLCDITMKDGMKMNNHKWVTNDEVSLK
jgi:predicted RND superfamily exporter protein